MMSTLWLFVCAGALGAPAGAAAAGKEAPTAPSAAPTPAGSPAATAPGSTPPSAPAVSPAGAPPGGVPSPAPTTSARPVALRPEPRAADPYDATVVEEKTFVFESPSPLGNVVRRVYVGEVLRVLEDLETGDGRMWAKVALGLEKAGYIEATRLMPTSRLKVVQYRPDRVIREELPIGVGFEMGGKTLGAGLLLRYQPFSRLGFSMSFAGLFGDENGALGVALKPGSYGVKGTVVSAGVTSFLVLWNLSPLLELGLSRVAYEHGPATLDMTTVYVSAGIEYMFNRGIFIGLAATYVRSLSVNVSYDFEYARDKQSVDVPTFGVLGSGEDTYQAIEPSLIVGYSF